MFVREVSEDTSFSFGNGTSTMTSIGVSLSTKTKWKEPVVCFDDLITWL